MAAAGVLGAMFAVPAAEASPVVANKCAPAATAVSFTDALDKTTANGFAVGGLSAIAYDSRSRTHVALVDRTGTQPARLVWIKDGRTPKVVRTTTLHRAGDGTPYDGTNFDGEGLAVLPNGDFLISSETEPSIRVFGRDGVAVAELEVPARFRVAPAGEAVENATLESLTVSPDGRFVYAVMEGALAGDAPAAVPNPTGSVPRQRVLVYRSDRHGGYTLDRQLAYQADRGNRIAEVTAYANGKLVVLEAAFTAGVGNTVRLYAATGAGRAEDVSTVPNLTDVAAGGVLKKRLIADLVNCPTLGATSPQPQLNPLLDNFEGLAVEPAAGDRHRLLLLSDDNFSANQKTRLLRMTAKLP